MKSLITGLILGLSLHAGELWAVPIAFHFTGTLMQVPVLDPADAFGGIVDAPRTIR